MRGEADFVLTKADRHVLLDGLSKLSYGYARELAARIEATKCGWCRGSGYAPYIGGDEDDAPCLRCDGTGFADTPALEGTEAS